MDIRYYVAYEDDGFSGPCGQITSVTSHRRQLHIFKSEKAAQEFIEKIRLGALHAGRTRSRIVGYWSNAPDFDNVVEE